MFHPSWIILTFAVLFSASNVVYLWMTSEPKIHEILEQRWSKSETDDTSINPFKIILSSNQEMDLKLRLASARLLDPDETDDSRNVHFTNLFIKVLNFWYFDYNWDDSQYYLNTFPQFQTEVNGLKIHYIHVKPTCDLKVVPLMLLHGWPGSVREFSEMIPLLTTPQPGRDFVFEVIVPSLPGVGFSEKTDKPGMTGTQMALIMKKLMKRVGFDKFFIHGSDWGGHIAQTMITLFPEGILGMHSTSCSVSTPLTHLRMYIGYVFPSIYRISEDIYKQVYPQGQLDTKFLFESGKEDIRESEIGVFGIALRDSPAALAAYILKHFYSDNSDLSEQEMTRFLDNVMIYWMTKSIPLSMIIYNESIITTLEDINVDRKNIKTPVVCTNSPHRLKAPLLPEYVIKDKFLGLKDIPELPIKGNFAAFEEPKIIADNIYDSIYKLDEEFLSTI